MNRSVLKLIRANTAPWSLGPCPGIRPVTLRLSRVAKLSNTTRNSHKAFWNGSRALLLSAFASSIAYLVGVTDAGNHVQELFARDRPAPVYGKAKDLQKVCVQLSVSLTHSPRRAFDVPLLLTEGHRIFRLPAVDLKEWH
jgi:hypothetical protein